MALAAMRLLLRLTNPSYQWRIQAKNLPSGTLPRRLNPVAQRLISSPASNGLTLTGAEGRGSSLLAGPARPGTESAPPDRSRRTARRVSTCDVASRLADGEEAHMEIGPVDVLVVEFPGNKFSGAIVPALLDLVRAGTVRVLDLLFVYKEADGTVQY